MTSTKYITIIVYNILFFVFNYRENKIFIVNFIYYNSSTNYENIRFVILFQTCFKINSQFLK